MTKIYEAIKNGPVQVEIIKPIDMGYAKNSDILEFMDPKYLVISEDGRVTIPPQKNVTASDPGNGCIDLTFDDGESGQDVIFDDNDEDEYIKIVQ